jgi:hypothetical protein
MNCGPSGWGNTQNEKRFKREKKEMGCVETGPNNSLTVLPIGIQ